MNKQLTRQEINCKIALLRDKITEDREELNRDLEELNKLQEMLKNGNSKHKKR